MRHFTFGNKNIILFGDYHGDTNNYCKNDNFLNLDDFIKNLIEYDITVGLYIEIPYIEGDSKQLNSEYELEKETDSIAMVYKSFQKCYKSTCANNFTLYPTDIRHYDKFLGMEILSVMLEEKNIYEKEVYLKSIVWCAKLLESILEQGIISNLIKQIKDNNDKKYCFIIYFNTY